MIKAIISLSDVDKDLISMGNFSRYFSDDFMIIKQNKIKAAAAIKYHNPSIKCQFLLNLENHKVNKTGAKEVETKKNFVALFNIIYFLIINYML